MSDAGRAGNSVGCPHSVPRPIGWGEGPRSTLPMSDAWRVGNSVGCPHSVPRPIGWGEGARRAGEGSQGRGRDSWQSSLRMRGGD